MPATWDWIKQTLLLVTVFQNRNHQGRLIGKKELNEEFFTQLYPGQEVKTEADFRNKIKEEIQAYWNGQATNQIHDQVFHILVEQTNIDFPEGFLKNG